MSWVKCVFAVACSLVLWAPTYGGISNSESSNTIARGFDPKSMLTNLATSIMSRGYGGGGGSQVVSLNLTNLLVLVLLKALIFAAGSLGAGTWKGGLGRSADGEERIVTDEEILFFLSYLTGEPGNNACLQNLACQQPQQAKRYAAAGDMLLKTAQMLSIDAGDTYQSTLQELQDAANFGNLQGDCSRYKCGTNTTE